MTAVVLFVVQQIDGIHSFVKESNADFKSQSGETRRFCGTFPVLAWGPSNLLRAANSRLCVGLSPFDFLGHEVPAQGFG